MAKSITHFLNPEDALEVQARLDGNDSGMRFVASKSLGGGWARNELWKQLGIHRVLETLANGRQLSTPVERAIFAMVANRALAPGSKRRVESWVKEDVAVPGLEEVSVYQLYRAMDFLLEAEEEMQREVYHSVAHLLNLEVDLLYFDTTSTYFEAEDPDQGEGTSSSDNGKRSSTIRRLGHSKDRRPDLPQVVIGLAVTREGIPIRCWVWPGNTADMSLIRQVKQDLIGWKLGRVITVVDRGFTSEENLRVMQQAGGHHIAGERMRSGKADVEAALSRSGGYQEIASNLHIKEIIIGEG